MKTNTLIDSIVPWSPDFDSDNPLFEPLRPLLSAFREYNEWPGLDAYQQLLDSVDSPLRTQHGAKLKIVAQEGKPNHFEQHYAPRIYLHGEIQTRTNNWHDFFQLLTWFVFPETKTTINAIHIPRAKQRIENGDTGRRSPVENMLSLFDEGGVVITSSNPELLQLVKDFKWKQLFWQNRAQLAGQFECTTFGHAMYEKALTPYIGMTANAILLHVDKTHFAKPMPERLADIDRQLATLFTDGKHYTQPHDLNPFPVLGMPGWYAGNNAESFYDNTSYFRPGRRFNKTTSS